MDKGKWYTDRYWHITDDGKGIRWQVGKTPIPHSDHVETAGKETALVIYYGVNSDGSGFQELHCVFPMLRLIPNMTHASFQANLKTGVPPEDGKTVSSGGRPTGYLPYFEVDGKALVEYPEEVMFNGIMRINSRSDVPGLRVDRIIYPSNDAPASFIWFILTNEGEEPVRITVRNNHTELISRGARGVYLVDCDMGEDALELAPHDKADLYLQITARTADVEKKRLDSVAEYLNRLERIRELTAPIQLKTGIAELDTAFHFCKLRAGESIFRTRGGYMHGPGGESYYAATWCNDQVEYAGPWFAWTGDALALEASRNAYHHYMPFMGPDFYHIPSSVISEGFDIWEGAKDRGDAAMWAYGASRFALTCGNPEWALKLAPGVEWCLEYCRRNRNEAGVVRSDTDEMEGRFQSGTANLCTSALYYGALCSASRLAESLNADPEVVIRYREQAQQLAEDMEEYFGAELHGFNTYRYYEGNSTLRSWIGIPLCMGLLNRADDTVAALYSEYLWANDGMMCEEGAATYWDRSLLYALRGAFIAGNVDETFEKLMSYTCHRLLGDHVPYPIEAWPEGNKRHLSAESALFCRIITEGLFGLEPMSFRSFKVTPRIPAECPEISLRNIHAFGHVFDVIADRERTVIRCSGTETVYPAGCTVVHCFRQEK